MQIPTQLYLDFAKAFDKVDHTLWLKKLQLYGISGNVFKWIENFLSKRTQEVVVNGFSSFIAEVISGVPQGTVLGPILFLIFLNDIESCVLHSSIGCFADDTRISKAIYQAEDSKLLQEDLNRILHWTEQNNMALHEDKFIYMNFYSSNMSFISTVPRVKPHLLQQKILKILV